MNLLYSKAGWGTGTMASLGRSISLHGDHRRRWLELFPSAINLVDTADSYGSGDAERLIARLFEDVQGEIHIVSKAGYIYSNLSKTFGPANQILKKVLQKFWRSACFHPEYLSQSLHRSLQRLNRSKLSGFLLHDPPLEVVQDAKVWEELTRLKTEGFTSLIGVSSGKREVLAEAVSHPTLDLLETPAYLKKAIELEDIWSLCDRTGVHVIGNHIFHREYLQDGRVSHEELASAAAAMLPANATLLCGTRNPGHLAEFARWVENPFPSARVEQVIQRAGVARTL